MHSRSLLFFKLIEMKTHKINIFDPFTLTFHSKNLFNAFNSSSTSTNPQCDENPVEKYFLEPIKSRKESYGRESKKCINFLILISLVSPSCGGELERKFIWKVSLFYFVTIMEKMFGYYADNFISSTVN